MTGFEQIESSKLEDCKEGSFNDQKVENDSILNFQV